MTFVCSLCFSVPVSVSPSLSPRSSLSPRHSPCHSPCLATQPSTLHPTPYNPQCARERAHARSLSLPPSLHPSDLSLPLTVGWQYARERAAREAPAVVQEAAMLAAAGANDSSGMAASGLWAMVRPYLTESVYKVASRF